MPAVPNTSRSRRRRIRPRITRTRIQEPSFPSFASVREKAVAVRAWVSRKATKARKAATAIQWLHHSGPLALIRGLLPEGEGWVISFNRDLTRMKANEESKQRTQRRQSRDRITTDYKITRILGFTDPRNPRNPRLNYLRAACDQFERSHYKECLLRAVLRLNSFLGFIAVRLRRTDLCFLSRSPQADRRARRG
jgi:hypothetical protein